MDEEERMNEGQAGPQAIDLSFNPEDPAWDDRELISGFDDAMEQFRLMNPGPGSMLDKMMAAAAKGETLQDGSLNVGAAPAMPSNLIRTRWYTSAIPPPTGGPSSRAAPALNAQSAKASSSNASKKKAKKTRQSGGAAPSGIKRVWDEEGNVIESEVGANGELTRSSWSNADSASKRMRFDPAIATGAEAFPPAADDMYAGPASPSYTPASPGAEQVELHDSYVGAGPRLPAHLEQSRTAASIPVANSVPSRNPYGAPRASAKPAIRPPQWQTQPRHRARSSAPALHDDYEPTTTGVYPEMGTGSGVVQRMGGFSISRQEASLRAVNAQWWAGYWYAMSEVLPSAEE